MIIDKTVKLNWGRSNKTWYVNKGYNFTKFGDEFEVRIEDLMDGCAIRIHISCDRCEDILYTEWKSYLKSLKENNIYYCNKCSRNKKNFEQWCIENDYQNILDRWDYKLNDKKPKQIGYGSDKKYYFKCPREIHESELKNVHCFTNGEKGAIKCIKCNSFAQWGIDNICSDFLKKYWNYEKNKNIDPWKISYGSSQKIWIKCQDKDYHESYKISCLNFINGYRCPYCAHLKIHPLDSLGTLYPQVLEVWSNKNQKSPYEYAPKSDKKVFWKCPNGKHKDFKRSISESNKAKFRCPSCDFSKGEKRIEDWLILNHIQHIPQKEFDNLLGVGNGNLSYDFYLPTYNLLIEYQGEFHDGTVPNQTREQFIYQKDHDKRKKQYAIDNNIRLLEIWYWDFDNVENILNRQIKGDE